MFNHLAAASPLLPSRGTGSELQLDGLPWPAAGSWDQALLCWDQACSETLLLWSFPDKGGRIPCVNWADDEGDRGKKGYQHWYQACIKFTVSLRNVGARGLLVPTGSVQSSWAGLWLRGIGSLFKAQWIWRKRGLLCDPLSLSHWNRPPTERKLLGFHQF